MNAIDNPTVTHEFQGFPKMARLSRDCLLTEKIDGSNGQIYITDEGDFLVGSRTRWITPESDNFGFARWAHEHKDELMRLGPGRHFGEWWGFGVQRGYGLNEKRFSLFNAIRWCQHDQEPQPIPSNAPGPAKLQEVAPACCHVVPVLYRGLFTTAVCDVVLEMLRVEGSLAAPGYPNPEGIIAYHIAGNVGFKKTIHGDEAGKGQAA